MNNQKETACNKFKTKSLSLDLYRRPFYFLMPDHRETYNTWMGSVLSLLTIVIVFTYAAYQMIILVSLDQYNVETTFQENFFSANSTLDQPFKVAAALTGWDGSQEPMDEPEYGEL